MDIGPTSTVVVVLAGWLSTRVNVGAISSRRRHRRIDIGPTSTIVFDVGPISIWRHQCRMDIGPTSTVVVELAGCLSTRVDVGPISSWRCHRRMDIGPTLTVVVGLAGCLSTRVDVGPISSRRRTYHLYITHNYWWFTEDLRKHRAWNTHKLRTSQNTRINCAHWKVLNSSKPKSRTPRKGRVCDAHRRTWNGWNGWNAHETLMDHVNPAWITHESRMSKISCAERAQFMRSCGVTSP